MQLRATFAELGMPSIPSIYPMPNVQDQFDDDGNARDPAHVRRVGRFLDELVRTDLMSAVSSVSRVAVLGTLTRGEGPAIGLRADMDALGFEEANDFAHRSTRRGKMHACGHDGHTAMLLGAARYLAETRRFRGSVHFIFKPAEENEAGGRVMVEQGLFEKFPVDAVYGMHNYPGLAVGRIALMAGPLMAAATSSRSLYSGAVATPPCRTSAATPCSPPARSPLSTRWPGASSIRSGPGWS